MSLDIEPTRRRFLELVTAAGAFLAATLSLPRIGRAAPPMWSSIPPQVWVVGQPVSLNLANYVADADGDQLAFSLDLALPPGLSLNGSVISGTPQAAMAQTSYVATADDGQVSVGPAAPTGLTVR